MADCDMCTTRCSDEDELKLHFATHHEADYKDRFGVALKAWQCGACPKTFPKKHHRDDHLIAHHPARYTLVTGKPVPLYECKVCHKFTTKYYGSMRQHYRDVEGIKNYNELTNESLVSTTVAPATSTSTSLGPPSSSSTAPASAAPVTSASTTDSRQSRHRQPYKCPKPGCDKSYSQQQGLTRHLRERHTTRRFKCTKCGKVLMRKEAVKDHIDSKHDGVGDVETVDVPDRRQPRAPVPAASSSSMQLRSSSSSMQLRSSSSKQPVNTVNDAAASSPSSSSTSAASDADIADDTLIQSHVAALSGGRVAPPADADNEYDNHQEPLQAVLTAAANVVAPRAQGSLPPAAQPTSAAASIVASRRGDSSPPVAASTSAGAASNTSGTNPRIADSALVQGIRSRMVTMGMTSARVGGVMGRSGEYIDKVLNGQQVPTEDELSRLSCLFAIPIKVLIYLFIGRGWL